MNSTLNSSLEWRVPMINNTCIVYIRVQYIYIHTHKYMLGLAWPNIYNDDDGLVGLVAMSILDQSTYTTQIDRQV